MSHFVNFSAVSEVQEQLQEGAPEKREFLFFHSRSGSGVAASKKSGLDGSIDFDTAIRNEANAHPEPKSIADNIHATDNLLYIYTSGTTGLPKAVIIKHIR